MYKNILFIVKTIFMPEILFPETFLTTNIINQMTEDRSPKLEDKSMYWCQIWVFRRPTSVFRLSNYNIFNRHLFIWTQSKDDTI